MAYPEEPQPLLVSLQDRTSADVQAGHIAAGALLGTDLAVFDLTRPDIRVDPDARLEVLLAPWDAGGGIEHIRPTHVEVASLDRSADARIVMVRLAQPSRHATDVPQFTEETFRRALEEHDDIWLAVESLGLTPPGLRDLDVSAALARVAEVEAPREGGLVHYQIGRSVEQILACVFSPLCLIRRLGRGE